MKIKVSGDVVARDLTGEAVLLDLAAGTYYGLDEVGSRIWHLVGRHGSIEPVIEQLLAEYDVEESRLRDDVERLIRELRSKGLVRTDEDAALSTD